MRRSTRFATLAIAAAAAVSLVAADAVAQGCPRGGYPPPFRPAGVVPPSGRTPGQTPAPTPTPRPGSDPTPRPGNPGDTTPRPGRGAGVTPGVPRPLPGTTRSGQPLRSTGAFDWEAWWNANQWRYLEFRPIVGETAPSGAEASENSRTITPEAMEEIVAALRTAAASSDPVVASEALAALAAVDGDSAAGEINRAAERSGRARLAGILAASRLKACDASTPASATASAQLKGLVENRSASASERGAAAVVLSVLGGAMPSFDLLAGLARDKSEPHDVRAGTALALALSCGHDGLDVLAALLKDPREAPPIRSAAAFALGRTGDRCAIAPLAAALADESSPERLRRAAASSLGAVAVRQEHPLDGETRRVAAETLIGAARGDDRLAVRGLAVVSLGQVGGVEAKLECRRILLEGPRELIAPALLALGLLGDAADGEFIEPWLAAEAEFRPAATLACGLIHDVNAMPAIRSMLETSNVDADLRMASLAAGLLGDTAAIPLLGRRVSSPPSTGIGEAALVGLGMLGHVSARAVVRRTADEATDRKTREAAFEVLGRMRDPGSPKRLKAVMSSTSCASSERAAAARALSLLASPPTALPPLEDVMIDRDPGFETPLLSTLVAAAD